MGYRIGHFGVSFLYLGFGVYGYYDWENDSGSNFVSFFGGRVFLWVKPTLEVVLPVRGSILVYRVQGWLFIGVDQWYST